MVSDYKEYICAECKFCCMHYDKQGWEVFSCSNDKGHPRGLEDEFQEACSEFELLEED